MVDPEDLRTIIQREMQETGELSGYRKIWHILQKYSLFLLILFIILFILFFFFKYSLFEKVGCSNCT